MANAADLTREVINELAFTPEELKELERARTMPITFDEDCPGATSLHHQIPPRACATIHQQKKTRV